LLFAFSKFIDKSLFIKFNFKMPSKILESPSTFKSFKSLYILPFKDIFLPLKGITVKSLSFDMSEIKIL